VAFDPLHREADAFRALVWFVGAIALIVVVALIIRAIA
jgi:hypothetical protein